MANSDQEIATPDSFVRAIERIWGIAFAWDLAADALNTKAPRFFTKEDDALTRLWPLDGWCWLNPPFKRLGLWVRKCKEQKDRGARIVSIWPLSGDMNQVPTWVESSVTVIHGRIWPEVRSCMLCMWNRETNSPVSGLYWNRTAGTLTSAWWPRVAI